MKRTQENKHEVRTHYSLFTWRECHFCHQEFRRESGYKWPAWNFYRYSCGDCSASVSHCSALIDYNSALTTALLMDEVPPAPPMRTYAKSIRPQPPRDK